MIIAFVKACDEAVLEQSESASSHIWKRHAWVHVRLEHARLRPATRESHFHDGAKFEAHVR
jgi:hypothetical protein